MPADADDSDAHPDHLPPEAIRDAAELSIVLDASDPGGLERYMADAGFLTAGEQITSISRAGEGNMNLALRVRTATRSLIVKQGRPWVEKYPSIAAPKDRTLIEAQWYELVGSVPVLAARMPQLLGVDAAARVLVLSDLGDRGDYLHLYGAAMLSAEELDSLIDWLSELHTTFAGDPRARPLDNRAMRVLNHEHIFEVPLRAGNGLELDRITPGLIDLASELRDDGDLLDAVQILGDRYLGPGVTLLHGDYYPGSWLLAAHPQVIDPEFGFFGPPEFDLGVMLAHLRLADQPPDLADRALSRYQRASAVDVPLLNAFAGIEVIRRLLGVSQLPVRLDLEAKQALIADAREQIVNG